MAKINIELESFEKDAIGIVWRETDASAIKRICDTFGFAPKNVSIVKNDCEEPYYWGAILSSCTIEVLGYEYSIDFHIDNHKGPEITRW